MIQCIFKLSHLPWSAVSSIQLLLCSHCPRADNSNNMDKIELPDEINNVSYNIIDNIAHSHYDYLITLYIILHRQREHAPPPTRPKPRAPSRQTSSGSIQNGTGAGTPQSPASYDPQSLFTPAYMDMMKVVILVLLERGDAKFLRNPLWYK